MKMISTILDRFKYFGLRKLYYFLLDTGIIFPTKQTLIQRGVSRKLITYFGGDSGHNINSSLYFIGFGLIHYAILRNCRPKRILCVGSDMGYIPAILALACKDNAYGHVDFVDAGYGKESPALHWGGSAFWKNVNPQKHFNMLHLSSFITTHVMKSKLFSKRFPRHRYQYIYIDGDHSYQGVKTDFKLFWPMLESGGFMVFHDIVAKGHLDGGTFGVWKFWNELSGTHTIQFSFPKDSGLGFIQKQ